MTLVMGVVPKLAGLSRTSADWREQQLSRPRVYRYGRPALLRQRGGLSAVAPFEAVARRKAPVECSCSTAEADRGRIDITAVDVLQDLYQELTDHGIRLSMARVEAGSLQTNSHSWPGIRGVGRGAPGFSRRLPAAVASYFCAAEVGADPQ